MPLHLSGIALDLLITTEIGLYTTVIDTYVRVSQSSQARKCLVLDYYKSTRCRSSGCFQQRPERCTHIQPSSAWILDNDYPFSSTIPHCSKIQPAETLAFIRIISRHRLSPDMCCLGRGWAHHVLLLPTGVLISFSAFPLSKHLNFGHSNLPQALPAG